MEAKSTQIFRKPWIAADPIHKQFFQDIYNYWTAALECCNDKGKGNFTMKIFHINIIFMHIA